MHNIRVFRERVAEEYSRLAFALVEAEWKAREVWGASGIQNIEQLQRYRDVWEDCDGLGKQFQELALIVGWMNELGIE